MSKTAIVVYSDPKAGTEEALGRIFNALFVAYELKEKKQEVALIFQGAGVRWPGELVNNAHPAHALYDEVKDTVAGVCRGCADVFGATDDVKGDRPGSDRRTSDSRNLRHRRFISIP